MHAVRYLQDRGVNAIGYKEVKAKLTELVSWMDENALSEINGEYPRIHGFGFLLRLYDSLCLNPGRLIRNETDEIRDYSTKALDMLNTKARDYGATNET